jgi:hypothetical protein
MNASDDAPAVRYEWQRPYLAAALETDSEWLPAKISEARREIRRRLSDSTLVDAGEQSAAADALNALATLEKERLHVDGSRAEEDSGLFGGLEDAGSEPSAA